jgi:hypothetical protein
VPTTEPTRCFEVIRGSRFVREPQYSRMSKVLRHMLDGPLCVLVSSCYNDALNARRDNSHCTPDSQADSQQYTCGWVMYLSEQRPRPLFHHCQTPTRCTPGARLQCRLRTLSASCWTVGQTKGPVESQNTGRLVFRTWRNHTPRTPSRTQF